MIMRIGAGTTLVCILLTACTGGGPQPSPTQAATGSHGQIVEVRQAPVPEGPPGPTFTRDVGRNSVFLSLKLIEPYIPKPLPDPLDQNGCTMGGSVFIKFDDHAEVEYGPCRTPASIDRLLDEMMRVQRSN